MSQRMSDQDSKKGEHLELIVTLSLSFLFRTCTLYNHAIADQQNIVCNVALPYLTPYSTPLTSNNLSLSAADHRLSPLALHNLTGPGVEASTYPH